TRVALAFAATLGPAAPDVPIAPYRSAHVELFLLPGETRVQQADYLFADGDTTSSYTLEVTVTSPNQRFLLGLTLRDDQGRVVYAARDTVTAFVPGSGPPPPPHVVALVYTGADTAARTLAVAPRDTVLVEGSSVRFTAVARRADGSAVAGATIRFSARGSGIAVDAAGSVRATAPVARGGAFVIARMPTGLSDSTFVTVAAPPGSLALAPDSLTLVVGRTSPLTATVLDARGTPLPGQVITFASGDTTTATVTASGLVTARAPGLAIITARSGALTATARIVVVPVPVARVVLRPDTAITLTVNGPAAVVTAEPQDAAGVGLVRPVTWSSADPAIATVIPDSLGRGIIVGRGAGVTTVTAASEGQLASVGLRVLRPLTASVRISPRAATVLAGDTMRFVATVLDTLGRPATQSPTWSLSTQPTAATVDAATGLVTAHHSGSVTLVASALGASDSVVVELRAAASITISPATVSVLGAGARARFVAVARDSTGAAIADVPLRWTVADPGIAKVDSTGPQALVLLAQRVGSTTVTASGGRVTAVATLQVGDPLAPASVTVAPAAATLVSIGELLPLVATVRNQAGATLLQAAGWASRDPLVATVDADGTVVARTNGAAWIVASAGGVADSARVVVRQVVDSILLVPDTLRLALGDTATLRATPVDRNRNPVADAVPGFASTDATAVTVTADGRVQLLRAAGASVVVTSAGRSSTATVLQGQGSGGVTARLARVRITPGSGGLLLGSTVPLLAELVDAAGAATPLAPAWASSEPGRVAVSALGVVTVLDTGAVTITATSQGIAGHARFTVLPAPALTGFTFAPAVLRGVATATVRFSVSVGATDPGLGIGAVEVEFTGPGGVARGCTATAPVVGTTRRGTWDCALAIPAGSPAGAWQATRVTMHGSIVRSAGQSQLAPFGSTTLAVEP
ncbi:MAG: Ig domain protein group 2 domain protein, partial [Gemmatimonadetes bacterium]|nr:Ig domain protein group 2 domain protein [Gemmatimonadota bacterium]